MFAGRKGIPLTSGKSIDLLVKCLTSHLCHFDFGSGAKKKTNAVVGFFKETIFIKLLCERSFLYPEPFDSFGKLIRFQGIKDLLE